MTTLTKLESVRAALTASKEFSDWFMRHSCQADYAHSELGEKLEETAGWKEIVDAGYNGLMASYHSQFEEALITLNEVIAEVVIANGRK